MEVHGNQLNPCVGSAAVAKPVNYRQSLFLFVLARCRAHVFMMLVAMPNQFRVNSNQFNLIVVVVA